MTPPLHESVQMALTSLLTGLAVGGAVYAVTAGVGHIKAEGRQLNAQLPIVFRLMYRLLPFCRPLLRCRTLVAFQPAVEKRLTQAGLEHVLSADDFIGLRILHAIVFSVIGLVSLALGTGFYVGFGLLVWAYGLLYPSYWLAATIRKRHRSIQRALPNVLDLLTLSVEAGRDFLTALQDILRNRDPDPLGAELERVFREVQLGKQRREALRNMGERVGDADLSTAVDALVQADELGVSIGSILRIIGEQTRAKRFHRAEKLANEAPVKLLGPLILFIFPAVMIIMLGPILLHALRSFI